MASIEGLKEIIVSLKLELIEARIPKGYCPYSLYTPTTRRKADCSNCERCRQVFMKDMEKDIREEVDGLQGI